MRRLPKIGDAVTTTRKGGRPEYPAGRAVGLVLDVIAGACGPIVAVQFDGYRGPHGPHTVDLHWLKVRKV